MILSLYNPNGNEMKNILDKKSFIEWKQSFETGKHNIGPFSLLSFIDLFKKIKSEAIRKPFEPSTTQDKTVDNLNRFRNRFIHHIPMTSGFYLRNRAKDLIDVILIIEFLAIKSNNILFHKEGHRELVADLWRNSQERNFHPTKTLRCVTQYEMDLWNCAKFSLLEKHPAHDQTHNQIS